jgi:hypothetical protein
VNVQAPSRSKPLSAGAAKPNPPVQPAAPEFSPPKRELIDPNADYSTEFCALTVRPDGTGEAVIFIAADVLKRIQTRAQNQDPADYLWHNVFRSALFSHVY